MKTLPNSVQGGQTRASTMELSGGTEILTWVGHPEVWVEINEMVQFSGIQYQVMARRAILTAKGPRTLITALREMDSP